MTVEKSQIKIAVTNDIGASMEDQLEKTKRTQYELEGAAAALKGAAKKIPLDICPTIDEMLSSGVIKDGMPALEIATLVKKQVIRCGTFAGHLGDVAGSKAAVLANQADGIQIAMDVVKKKFDAERDKLQAIVDAADGKGGNGARPVGTHPGMSTATQRKSAEASARSERGTAAQRKAAEAKDKKKKATKKKAKKVAKKKVAKKRATKKKK